MRKILIAKHMGRCMGCMSCMFACARRLRGSLSVAKSAIRVRTKGGFSSGTMTADHCMGCAEPPCISSCPKGALRKRTGGGVLLAAGRCDGCGSCIGGCPVSAIFWDRDKNLPVICIHCGNCAEFCPHGCLAVEERD